MGGRGKQQHQIWSITLFHEIFTLLQMDTFLGSAWVVSGFSVKHKPHRLLPHVYGGILQQHSIWWKNLYSCLSSSKYVLKFESFHFITFISGWRVIIVIPGFKFIIRRPKIVLSRICAAYLCLVCTKLLETVSVLWPTCFVSTITVSGWLFEALKK